MKSYNDFVKGRARFVAISKNKILKPEISVFKRLHRASFFQ